MLCLDQPSSPTYRAYREMHLWGIMTTLESDFDSSIMPSVRFRAYQIVSQ